MKPPQTSNKWWSLGSENCTNWECSRRVRIQRGNKLESITCRVRRGGDQRHAPWTHLAQGFWSKFWRDPCHSCKVCRQTTGNTQLPRSMTSAREQSRSARCSIEPLLNLEYSAIQLVEKNKTKPKFEYSGTHHAIVLIRCLRLKLP